MDPAVERAPANTEARPRAVGWRELVAAFGVILSLVFVGLEIRQNTAVARGQARQELATLNQGFLALLSQEEQGRIWYRAWVGNEELDPVETLRASVLMTMALRRFENVYLQYSEGLIDESALGSYGLQRAELYESARFRELWRSQRQGFDPGFVEYFESRIGM